jgi:hypothetical protein
MTAALLETPAPVWTPDGCLATVPARAANDNHDAGPGMVPTATWSSSPSFRFTVHGIRPPLSFGYLPPVIALSGAAGSGKSTVSDFLVARFGYTRTKFAKPLKDMCRAIGMTEAQIEGDEKETPLRWLCGRTPRHAMQTLGLEWGRKCMGDDFWVDLWARSVLGKALTVVDDCRFANEAAAVRRMGGRVVRLIGRGGIAGGHASEAADFLADEVICNDGSIADLQERVVAVLEGWR